MTTSKPKAGKPARKWSQIRIHPEEERLINEISKRTGLSRTTTARQLIRKALGLTSAGL
jgi:predicted DNA-binding protein